MDNKYFDVSIKVSAFNFKLLSTEVYGTLMIACQVCLKQYSSIKFKSRRLAICGHCVNLLNEVRSCGQLAEARLGELLRKGMLRRAEEDIKSGVHWRRDKGAKLLENFDDYYLKALPGWLNRLAGNDKESSPDVKVLRAYRRGLLFYSRPKIDLNELTNTKARPKRFAQIAKLIRKHDHLQCKACGCVDQILDVHHIVYLSNYGTNRKQNLISLCRPCHEKTHGRSFDPLEEKLNLVVENEQTEGNNKTKSPIVKEVQGLPDERSRSSPEISPEPTVQPVSSTDESSPKRESTEKMSASEIELGTPDFFKIAVAIYVTLLFIVVLLVFAA